MLHGAFEWTVGLVATAIVVTIVSWYAVDWAWQSGPGSAPPPPGQQVKAAVASRPAAATAATGRPERRGARVATYAFVATRGDSWLQARSGSHAGRILFEGTLVQGAALRLRARRLWVRFGAASYVDLRIDGERTPLPLFGTFDAVVSRTGVRPDRTVYVDAPQATAAQSP